MIPKKIHYCWLSGDPLPELAQKCLSSWKQFLPDYEIVLWDLNKFDINSTPWTKESFESKKYAFAADYIRLYALYTEGGIYLDSDVEVIQSFDNFLNCESFIGFESSGDIEPAVLGAEKGSAWIGKSLKYYQNRHFVNSKGNYDTKPLPIVLEQFLNLKNIDKKNITKSNNICFYPAEYFSPKNFYTKKIEITSFTVSIHHFDGSWLNESLKDKIKNIIHNLILKIFGKKNHKRIVNFIRYFNK